MKNLKSILSLALLTSVGPLWSSVSGTVVFELTFPYSSSWAQPVISGLGNGIVDFDGDGESDDAARGLKASTPEDSEYRGTANFTSAGPELVMRGVLAHLGDSTLTPPRLSSHGVTKSSIRLEGTRANGDLSNDMGYVGWWYVPAASFSNGGSPVSFANGGTLDAAAIRSEAMTGWYSASGTDYDWRFLVKNDGDYYVSKAVSSGPTLSIANLAEAEWIPYPNAEAGLTMRLNTKWAKPISGEQLTEVEGVGIYAEMIGFDGSAMAGSDRVLLDVEAFSLTLP